jgi:hypothetical protein
MSEREQLEEIDQLIQQATEEEQANVCTAYATLAIAKILRLEYDRRRNSIF